MRQQALSPEEIRGRILRWCAQQERAPSEVRRKLRDLGAGREQALELEQELLERDFLNPERFARTFAGGKFRQLGWGRVKIQAELLRKGLPEELIAQALAEEIPEADYQQTLRRLAERYLAGLDEPDAWKRRTRLLNYLQQKGYAYDTLLAVVQPLLDNLPADGPGE